MAAKKRYFVFVRISLEYFRIFPRVMVFKMGQMEKKFFGDHRYVKLRVKGKIVLRDKPCVKGKRESFSNAEYGVCTRKFFSVCLQTDNNPTEKKIFVYNYLATPFNHTRLDNDKNSKKDKNYSNHKIMMN